VDQCKRGEKLRHQDGSGVFVGDSQPAGGRAVEQGEAFHRVHLPDIVGLFGPLVVFLGDAAHAWRSQPGLLQPQLQGAGGWNQLGGVEFEQIEAKTWRSPGRMLAAQSTTRLLHGETLSVKRASAAVEVGQQVRARRLSVPLPEQTADRAFRDRHKQSNLWRREALLMKIQDALTGLGRCGGRHEECLPGKRAQRKVGTSKQGGPTRAHGREPRDLG
jgi:hypothetical protein